MTSRSQTPFGPAISTFATKADFYAANPALAEGWNPEKHPQPGPLGWDLVSGNGDQDAPNWVVTFCAPERSLRGVTPSGRGSVVAIDLTTRELYVIAEDIEFSAAQDRYQTS